MGWTAFRAATGESVTPSQSRDASATEHTSALVGEELTNALGVVFLGLTGGDGLLARLNLASFSTRQTAP